MGMRGFDALIGETVVRVDTNAINVVHIHTASGKVVSVDAELSHHGIPVVQVGTGWDVEEHKPLVPTHIYVNGRVINYYGMIAGVWYVFYRGGSHEPWEHMESASLYNGEIGVEQLTPYDPSHD
ncbi:MAG: hypothetical protein [Caudoviricetes sp.]|nr:MAG: hypothetical protein [Caudoviricetes sp.]